MAAFRQDKFYFAEHLALSSYASGFRSIAFTLVVAPFWMLTQWNYSATLGMYLGAWCIYFGIACAQFYTGNRWWLLLKGVLVAVLVQLTAYAIIVGAIWSWFRFFHRA